MTGLNVSSTTRLALRIADQMLEGYVPAGQLLPVVCRICGWTGMRHRFLEKRCPRCGLSRVTIHPAIWKVLSEAVKEKQP